MAEKIPSRGGRTDCLILGNGPSLLGRDWATVPRADTFIAGVNQSWRVVPDADAHVAVDYDQFPIAARSGVLAHLPEALVYYKAHAAKGTLFHCGSGAIGTKLDRHDALTFSRHPFRKRHRGAHVPAPPLSEDGGVVLKVGHESGGSSCYIALQLAAAMGFERLWFVGLDIIGGKFTGTKSNSLKHDNLWRQVPEDVRSRVSVIGPSATQVFPVVEWPWKAQEAAA